MGLRSHIWITWRVQILLSRSLPCCNSLHCLVSNSLPNDKILDSSKLKESEDENGRQLFKQVEKMVGKGENCSLREISPFPTVFSKRLVLQTP